ncbi:MAG: fimbrial protein [Rhizobiaceae bacterium]
MAGGALDHNEDPPLDPAAERLRRKLVRFMAINLAILFAAVMAVLLALVYRGISGGEADTPPAADASGEPVAGTIALPPGARVVSQSLSGSRIAIDVELPDGARAILVYDLVGGRLVGRYDVTAR